MLPALEAEGDLPTWSCMFNFNLPEFMHESRSNKFNRVFFFFFLGSMGFL